MLCNACGLFLKLHGRSRPISLKTDVIKSRNRVKVAPGNRRVSTDGPQNPNGFPAAHPDLASGGLNVHSHPHSHIEQIPHGGVDLNSVTGADVHGLAIQNNPNIAPQHMFDTISLPSDAFASPSLPTFGGQPSPGSVNGNTANLDAPLTYDALQAQNQNLRTRVNELEVINDLFRGRVVELEHAEEEARRAERTNLEEASRFQSDLNIANTKVAELQKRLAEFESQSTLGRKRTRRTATEEPNVDDDMLMEPV